MGDTLAHLGQLEALVARGHAVDITTRSLLACFQTLVTRDQWLL